MVHRYLTRILVTSFGIAQNVLGRIKLDPVGMCKRVGVGGEASRGTYIVTLEKCSVYELDHSSGPRVWDGGGVTRFFHSHTKVFISTT